MSSCLCFFLMMLSALTTGVPCASLAGCSTMLSQDLRGCTLVWLKWRMGNVKCLGLRDMVVCKNSFQLVQSFAWGQELLDWVGFILKETVQKCGNNFLFFPRYKDSDLKEIKGNYAENCEIIPISSIPIIISFSPQNPKGHIFLIIYITSAL